MTSVTNIRLRVLPRFPASITGTNGLTVDRELNGLIVKPDFGALAEAATVSDADEALFIVWNRETGEYNTIAYQAMFDNSGNSAGYATTAAAEAAMISLAVHAIELYGDVTVGDGNGGLWIDSNNGSLDTFVSGDGRTWYRAADVGTARLLDSAVDTAKIADGAATNAKLANMATATIKGRATVGTGAPEDLTPTQTRDLLKLSPTVLNYGATADGVAADNASVAAMAAALGYVTIPAGFTCNLTTATIAVPLFFQDNAAITAAAGQTITITNRITAPKQQIFKGDGSYIINVAGAVGEDAKKVHVSWFGVFPTNTTATDQAPAIQKALDSLGGQVREGILLFDAGSYHVASAMVSPRAVTVLGDGVYLTTFDVVGDAYDVFTTGGTACKFIGIQFEQSVAAYRTGALIKLAHASCIVDNARLWNSEYGVVVEGANCNVSNLIGSYGVTMPAGTAMVLVKAGGCTVDDIKVNSTTSGPTALVEIGKGAAAAISLTRVTNVQTTSPSIPVLITADTSNVAGVNISDVMFNGSGADAAAALVSIVTTGSAGVSGVTMSGLNGNSLATTLVSVAQGSSGVTEDIVIGNSVVRGSTGTGIALTRTAGTLRDIKIGDTVDVSDRATPIGQTGTMSDIKISPLVLPNAQPTLTYSISNLADDTATSINLGRSFFSGSVEITAGIVRHGIFTARAQSTPSVSANRITDANTVAVATTLAGTTGVDGNLTLGVQDGVLYVENRTGSSQNISLTVKAQ